jgi:hypothetical protein
MENNKNLFVIPTNNPSRVYGILGSYRLGLTSNDPFYTENFGGGTQNQNIYVTCNDFIGLSYYLDGDLVRKGVVDAKDYWEVRKDYKKIILTTDPKLIKDGVQSIPDEFLQWFIAKVNDSGKPIDIVEIEYLVPKVDNPFQQGLLNGLAKSYPDIVKKPYIIIPKEAEEQVRPYSAEQYDSEITPIPKEQRKKFKVMIVGDGKPQQETLEQVAERILANNIDGLKDALKDDDLFFFYKGVVVCYGEAMAEWQQEQDKKMYSTLETAISLLKQTTEFEVLDSWKQKVRELEQFKNK